MAKKYEAFEGIPESVMNALSSRRPDAFYRAVNRTGYEPQDTDQLELYEQGRAQTQLPRSSLESKAELFMRLTKGSIEFPEDIFKEISLKRAVLIALGYKSLKAKNGTVRITDAKDSRVGRVFCNQYRASSRELRGQ